MQQVRACAAQRRARGLDGARKRPNEARHGPRPEAGVGGIEERAAGRHDVATERPARAAKSSISPGSVKIARGANSPGSSAASSLSSDTGAPADRRRPGARPAGGWSRRALARVVSTTRRGARTSCGSFRHGAAGRAERRERADRASSAAMRWPTAVG